MTSKTAKSDQYKLETTFHEDYVIHTTYGSDLASGRRQVEIKTKWKRKEVIGEGAFGTVWLEEEEARGELRAVKRMSNRVRNFDFSRELYTLKKIMDKPTLFVQFLGWYEDKEFIFLAMEYMKHGDLSQYLVNFGPKARLEAKEIVRQLLEGLVVLHERNICHRDLKPQNVLIASTFPIWVKITDFGLSKREKGTVLRTNCGTSGYIAPELIGLLPRSSKRESYARSVDIWSLGIMTHEVLTSEIPFLQVDSDRMSESGFESELLAPEVDMAHLYEYCYGHKGFPLESLQNSQVSEKGQNFVMGLLVADPSARMSATDALESPWLLEKDQETSEEHQTSHIDLAVVRNPLAFISDSEDDPGTEGDSDLDGSMDWLTVPASPKTEPYPIITSEQSFARMSAFIRRKGLESFFPDDSIISLYVEQAMKMYKRLESSSCTWMIANQLTLLTLYDLVVLVDDSSAMAYAEGGPYLETLNETLGLISSIYGLARDEGIVAVRFFNSRRGRRNVTGGNVKHVLEGHDFEGTARIGTELKKKIIDRFVSSEPEKMKKPLLVVVITNGIVSGEHPALLHGVLRNAILDSKKPNSVVFQFVLIGCSPLALKTFKTLEDDYEVGGHIDCLQLTGRNNEMSPEMKWILACRLLLQAISDYWDCADEGMHIPEEHIIYSDSDEEDELGIDSGSKSD